MPEPIGENDEYIEPTDNVINITYYDSSDDEFEDLDDNDDYYTDNEEDEFDEKTSEKRKFLDEYFQEIADIVSYGNSKLKIMFHDKRGVKLVGKDIKCDFDIDEDGYPLIHDGGESYILPYIKLMCEKKKDLKPLEISTNCDKKKHSF